MGLFGKKSQGPTSFVDFSYLDKDAYYFDSACQTLRPQSVIDAMGEYFHGFNSCGGRVKYAWGQKVDEHTEIAKKLTLEHFGKSASDYTVAFTLNTTTGLNIVMNQLPPEFRQVVTTEIEHNAVFLTTMALANRLEIPRSVLAREVDGSVKFDAATFDKTIFVANNFSNIDGRELRNLPALADAVHATGGIVLIDAAQGALYGKEILRKADFDMLAFSGHKIYGPSIGIIVIKHTLLARLKQTLLGGGMVEDVSEHAFTPLKGEYASTLLELGLQDYAGIVGLCEALRWNKKHDFSDIKNHAEEIYNWLSAQPSVHVVNSAPGPVISFYSDKIDAHQLAIYLSEQGIMARSGYFCCHYYLKHIKNYPPLLRISLGAHNTKEQVEKLTDMLGIIFKNIS